MRNLVEMEVVGDEEEHDLETQARYEVLPMYTYVRINSYMYYSIHISVPLTYPSSASCEF